MNLHVTSETPWYGFLVTWPTFENSKTSCSLELLTVKHVHIICYMLSFPSTFIRLWCTCEELESIKKAKKWGVFYRCEEYTWMLYEFWERTYFSHTCEILVWNPWHIGTSSSRAVEEMVPIIHGVKFTKCEIYGSTMHRCFTTFRTWIAETKYITTINILNCNTTFKLKDRQTLYKAPITEINI